MGKLGGMLSAAELGHYAEVRVTSWKLVSGRQFHFDFGGLKLQEGM